MPGLTFLWYFHPRPSSRFGDLWRSKEDSVSSINGLPSVNHVRLPKITSEVHILTMKPSKKALSKINP